MKLILLFILLSFAGVKAEASEWRCKAMPPKNTKYRNVIGAISIDEDRKIAEKNALWLCKKLFKVECKIKECRKI